MTALPMNTAPKDGSRILLLADLASAHAENAFNDFVTAAWDAGAGDWQLSPRVEGTRIADVNGWAPLPSIPGPAA